MASTEQLKAYGLSYQYAVIDHGPTLPQCVYDRLEQERQSTGVSELEAVMLRRFLDKQQTRLRTVAMGQETKLTATILSCINDYVQQYSEAFRTKPGVCTSLSRTKTSVYTNGERKTNALIQKVSKKGQSFFTTLAPITAVFKSPLVLGFCSAVVFGSGFIAVPLVRKTASCLSRSQSSFTGCVSESIAAANHRQAAYSSDGLNSEEKTVQTRQPESEAIGQQEGLSFESSDSAPNDKATDTEARETIEQSPTTDEEVLSARLRSLGVSETFFVTLRRQTVELAEAASWDALSAEEQRSHNQKLLTLLQSIDPDQRHKLGSYDKAEKAKLAEREVDTFGAVGTVDATVDERFYSLFDAFQQPSEQQIASDAIEQLWLATLEEVLAAHEYQ
ncbi:MAG: hypothetical protein AAFV85_26200 [Cyanobacteria bacterium J06634_6]